MTGRRLHDAIVELNDVLVIYNCTFNYKHLSIILTLKLMYICLSVCLWLNNSKTAEPIGLKLIECLLLGPGMVLG